MELIGLSGYARSGKDEAAKVLVDHYQFTRVAFADKLKQFVYQQNPIIGVKPYFNWAEESPVGFTNVRLREVVDLYGWEGTKETEFKDEIRGILQRTGTEAGRKVISDNIWVDAALTGHPDDARIVVTDCRFPNEAQRIKDLGGIVVRVNRPGVKAVNAHPSESALDDWAFDYTLENNVDGLENWYYEVSYWYALRQKLQGANVG